jgi:PAS domain S-box-containing protein
MGQEADGKAAAMPPGLEGSRPVFDRATRLAKTLFGDVMARITLETSEGFWRNRDNSLREPSRAPGIRTVMETGEVVWLEDARADDRFKDELEVARPGGVRFFAGAPIRLPDGTTPGVLWVAAAEPRAFDGVLARRLQDLADFAADEWTRVTAAHAKADYERTMTAIVEALPISMVMTDRDARLLYASPRWIQARGLEGQDVVGKTLFDLRPDMFEPWREGLSYCMGGHAHAIDRLQVPTADGGTEWVRVQLAPWYDAGGEVGGLIITSYEITQIVEALERSERSEERMRLALELADLHVYEVDYIRRELFKVGAEDTFFDRPRAYKDLAENVWSSIDPRDRPMMMALWTGRGPEGPARQPEFRIAREDGAEVWAAGVATLIHDDAGRPIRLVGALRNITAEKQSEAALVQAKEEAEAANRAKSAFLATMSHEIRTPLNGVLGMAQALAADPSLSPAQRAQIEVIHQSGESLLTILNDVLDLSKIEAGKLVLEMGRFEVEELARAVQATFQAVADAKGLSFELSVDRAAEGAYEGDAVRVRQILWNLVSNALKFTEAGGVKVRIGRERGALSLTVFDSGIGMNPEQLAGLFRKFEQADASTTRRFGGTGLGLAICRELAELMGGGISATSAPGMGSTFTVLLPLDKVAGATRAPKARRAKGRREPSLAPSLRVLAAEDNAMNQPELVSDGRQAVEAWERESWDLILMDVQMPIMDGPTATALIRTRERAQGRRRTPIVALTANAMSHQIAEYLEAGMDAFVAKPIEAGRLFETLATAVRGVEASGDTAAA